MLGFFDLNGCAACLIARFDLFVGLVGGSVGWRIWFLGLHGFLALGLLDWLG